MSGKIFDTGVVSWRIFDALFEHQYDFCRKLQFFIRAGHATKEESVALELIADLLSEKLKGLLELREDGFGEREKAGGPAVKVVPEPKEPMIEKGPIQQHDRVIFGKMMDICRNGGAPWESLRALIERTHSSEMERPESG